MKLRWKQLWDLEKGPFNMITDIEPKENYKHGARHEEILVLKQSEHDRVSAAAEFEKTLIRRGLKPVARMFTARGYFCLPIIRTSDKKKHPYGVGK